MEAVILRRRTIREYDQIICAYTLEFGKRELFAKSVKKIVSKNSSQLEPGSRLYLQVVGTKEFDLITTVQTVNLYPAIRQSSEHSLAAGWWLAFVDQLSVINQPDGRVFELLVYILEQLNHVEQEIVPILDLAVFRLMMYMGFMPELVGCAMCGELASDQALVRFFVSKGGIVCSNCQISFLGHDTTEVGVLMTSVERQWLISALKDTIDLSDLLTSATATTHKVVHLFATYYSERQLTDWVKFKNLL